LCECVGSDALGWTTAGLSFGVCIWYTAIIFRWWEAATASSPATRKVWIWLMVIFGVCTVAGYASLIIAMAAPKTAHSMRIMFLALQNIACPVFWFHAASRRFGTMGRNERIGSELSHAIRNKLQAVTLKSPGVAITDMENLTEKEAVVLALDAVNDLCLRRAAAIATSSIAGSQ